MFSIVSRFGWGGKSLTDLSAWQEVGKSTSVGGVSGFGAAGLFFGAPRIISRGSTPPSVVAVAAPRMVDVHVADVMRASTGLVSDAQVCGDLQLWPRTAAASPHLANPSTSTPETSSTCPPCSPHS